ncbi:MULTISPECIES: 2-oxo-4-hydroxy-4-carboxy-5-ureidoimidazoline decarboxylase [Streptomyces]|uniref:2-oxo-4-hydroxy-4-carboxy-5-ureidoimidazoline decarboxylase n=1 Tax=Streptomyces TaxID=1883 RepID=UPI0037DD3181
MKTPNRYSGPRPASPSVAAHPHRAPRSPPLSSHLPAQARGSSAPFDDRGLARFNTLPAELAEAVLLQCCGSPRWAQQVAAHRPYPDAGALRAAADEASYDLSDSDLVGALAGEPPVELAEGAPYAAHLALGAARAEYERTFGHSFVICLDGHPPEERAGQLMAAIRRRMGLEVEEERAISAEELRRLALARLADLMDRLASREGVSGAETGRFARAG